jgi:hypothetical protein
LLTIHNGKQHSGTREGLSTLETPAWVLAYFTQLYSPYSFLRTWSRPRKQCLPVYLEPIWGGNDDDLYVQSGDEDNVDAPAGAVDAAGAAEGHTGYIHFCFVFLIFT